MTGIHGFGTLRVGPTLFVQRWHSLEEALLAYDLESPCRILFRFPNDIVFGVYCYQGRVLAINSTIPPSSLPGSLFFSDVSFIPDNTDIVTAFPMMMSNEENESSRELIRITYSTGMVSLAGMLQEMLEEHGDYGSVHREECAPTVSLTENPPINLPFEQFHALAVEEFRASLSLERELGVHGNLSDVRLSGAIERDSVASKLIGRTLDSNSTLLDMKRESFGLLWSSILEELRDRVSDGSLVLLGLTDSSTLPSNFGAADTELLEEESTEPAFLLEDDPFSEYHGESEDEHSSSTQRFVPTGALYSMTDRVQEFLAAHEVHPTVSNDVLALASFNDSKEKALAEWEEEQVKPDTDAYLTVFSRIVSTRKQAEWEMVDLTTADEEDDSIDGTVDISSLIDESEETAAERAFFVLEGSERIRDEINGKRKRALEAILGHVEPILGDNENSPLVECAYEKLDAIAAVSNVAYQSKTTSSSEERAAERDLMSLNRKRVAARSTSSPKKGFFSRLFGGK